MRKNRNNFGFSLTEVLLALGTLSIGMIFVAGVFPVAIYFSTQATEQTIAAVVADEAIAKIRLFAVGDPIDPTDDLDFTQLIFDGLTNFEDALGVTIDPGEFSYPSDPCTYIADRRYWWSALLRRASADPCSPLVQVTVFVSRRIGAGTTYRYRTDPDDPFGISDYPVPVVVRVSGVAGGGNENKLTIDAAADRPLINDGYAIVDDENGQIYQVRERYPSPNDDTIELDRPWNPGLVSPDRVWVIPPPVRGGRYPCIAVYQKLIRF